MVKSAKQAVPAYVVMLANKVCALVQCSPGLPVDLDRLQRLTMVSLAGALAQLCRPHTRTPDRTLLETRVPNLFVRA